MLDSNSILKCLNHFNSATSSLTDQKSQKSPDGLTPAQWHGYTKVLLHWYWQLFVTFSATLKSEIQWLALNNEGQLVILTIDHQWFCNLVRYRPSNDFAPPFQRHVSVNGSNTVLAYSVLGILCSQEDSSINSIFVSLRFYIIRLHEALLWVCNKFIYVQCAYSFFTIAIFHFGETLQWTQKAS